MLKNVKNNNNLNNPNKCDDDNNNANGNEFVYSRIVEMFSKEIKNLNN